MLVENATSPWGQSREWVLHKHSCIQFIARKPSEVAFSTKGQLISKCPFVVFKSPKNPSKKFPGFLPYPLKRGQINKVV